MIQFKSLRQYTHIVDGIRFPQNREAPFLLIYFSENSNFLDDYRKLNLKLLDFRTVIVPVTKIPRTRLGDLRKVYRAYKLFAHPMRGKLKSTKNLILDLSQYLAALDSTFKVSNYRQRAGFLIKNLLQKTSIYFPKNYQQVFLYSVNVTKGMNTFINRKIFPVVQQLKTDEFRFQHMLINVITESGSRYRLLVKDREFNFMRVKQFLKSVKHVDVEQEEETDVKKAADTVMKTVDDDILPKSKKKVKAAVTSYLSKDKDALDSVSSGVATKSDIQQVATTSILYKTSGKLQKSKRLAKAVPDNKKKVALRAVDRNYSDELLEPQKTVALSGDPRVTVYDPAKAVGDKSPEHIFQKRQIDFETNLKKDLSNTFKLLQTTKPSLKLQTIKVVDKPQRAGELDKSDISIVEIRLRDDFGNDHNVSIETPKINPNTGTFRVNGKTKCIVNQIVQCPITFPKPGISRFESAYSIFRIESKKIRKEQYLEGFMGNFRFLLLFLLSYAFGFEETLKLYNLSYEILTRKLKKDEFGCKVDQDRSILFKNVDSELKKQLCQSFVRGKIDTYKIDAEFGTKKYFEDFIIQDTGRINSTYLIDQNVQNIVDPVARQILLNKELPVELHLIMKYMSEGVIQGKVIERNDITNQRIKNSEVLVHLAQEQILSSYTNYKQQVLSGNTKAKFILSPTKVLSDFNQTEVVVDMEYANPVEEMAVITRVSPVGKRVGGIPDKRAIQTGARNVHDSYFGNIDPLDTPEGGNVGIVQQLTVDAYITSARGLFAGKKITNTEGSGMLSTTTCMIPFVENNEGARVLMAAGQAKQALPLKGPQPPVVQSGYESILTNVLSDNFIKRSPCSGKIVSITSSEIRVHCKDGKTRVVDITPSHLRSMSGKDTLSIFKPTVKTNQIVKKGDIIAEGGCMSNGSISLGRTLCVALMPYKGYNFEDSIVINEKLVEEDQLTSLHGVQEEVLISKEDRLLFIEKAGTLTDKGQILLRKTFGEVEQLIGFEEDETSEVSAGQYIHRSPGGRIVDIEVFSNVADDVFPLLKELIKKTSKKYGKLPKEKFTVSNTAIKGVLVRFKLEQELKIRVPDKLVNRYGNKGIISLIEKDENMPRSPLGDRIDIILNPVGVIGRMNMGQIFEMYCGLISKELGRKIAGMSSKTQVVNLLKRVLTNLDGSKNQQSSTRMISNLSRMSDTQFKKFMSQIKDDGFVPIIVPPFQSPSYRDISSALKVLGLKPAYQLYLPEFRTKTKNAVPLGYMYISKLEHIGELKIFGRSTGPTVSKTFQPTAGKRHEGGQRLGELDTYSFISYNCPNVLAELLGPLSDDPQARDEIISDIIQTGSAEYRPAKISPARDLLESYFASLMLARR